VGEGIHLMEGGRHLAVASATIDTANQNRVSMRDANAPYACLEVLASPCQKPRIPSEGSLLLQLLEG
jgi:hypothetical protein